MPQSNSFISKFNIKPQQSGVLDSLTFSVKDCIDIKEYVTGFGNPDFAHNNLKSPAHAVCVEQLLNAGATCFGKTIMDEFSYSLIGENYFYGTPLNPRLPRHVPGGSSSGSASSVACGEVDFSLGTDTGGSVRVPASNCGIWGYRPTHSRISVSGVLPLAPSLDTIGLFANSFTTLKDVVPVLLSEKFESTKVLPELILLEDVLSICSPNIINAIKNFLKLNSINYTSMKLSAILDVEAPITTLKNLYFNIHSCEAWNSLGSFIDNIKPMMGPIANYNLNTLARNSARDALSDSLRTRESIRREIQTLLAQNRIFIIPTTPEIAPLKGLYTKNPENRTNSNYSTNLIGINALASLCKLPQITLPINDVNDNPIGLSFIANNNHDLDLLNLLEKFT